MNTVRTNIENPWRRPKVNKNKSCWIKNCQNYRQSGSLISRKIVSLFPGTTGRRSSRDVLSNTERNLNGCTTESHRSHRNRPASNVYFMTGERARVYPWKGRARN